MRGTCFIYARGALLALFALVAAACQSGLDPRRFDRVAYGGSAADVRAALGADVSGRLKILADSGDGSALVLDRYMSTHPHPDYYVAYRDGELCCVLLANDLGRRNQWLGSVQTVKGLAAIERRLLGARLPLSWEQLGPLDAEHRTQTASPEVVMLTWMVIWPPVAGSLAILPVVWVAHECLMPDIDGIRNALTAKALALPWGARKEAVEDALGTPSDSSRSEEEPGTELWSYSVRAGGVQDFACRLGFVDGRLKWVYANRPAGP